MEVSNKPRAGGVLLKNLKRIRQREGYSVRDLADKSGVNASTISQLENLRRGTQARSQRRLAEALDVRPSELVGE